MIDLHPRRLARRLVLFAILVGELAVLAELRLPRLTATAVGGLASLSVLLVGYAFAVLLIDPLSRRYAEADEARRWSAVGETTRGYVRSVVQSVAFNAIYPLYAAAHAQLGRRADIPFPDELAYFDAQTTPAVFRERAGQMLNIVERMIEADHSERPSELGRFMIGMNAEELIERGVTRLADAVRLYSALPVRFPGEAKAVLDLHISAIQHQDATWGASRAADIAGADEGTRLRLGTVSLGAHHLGRRALSAFCLLHGLDVVEEH